MEVASGEIFLLVTNSVGLSFFASSLRVLWFSESIGRAQPSAVWCKQRVPCARRRQKMDLALLEIELPPRYFGTLAYLPFNLVVIVSIIRSFNKTGGFLRSNWSVCCKTLSEFTVHGVCLMEPASDCSNTCVTSCQSKIFFCSLDFFGPFLAPADDDEAVSGCFSLDKTRWRILCVWNFESAWRTRSKRARWAVSTWDQQHPR